jgi:hypothetical protein
VCFALHELDAHRRLHAFLVPLLRFARQSSWEIALHFDRGAREGVAWPPLDQRRWGPPIAGLQYLNELPEERPSDTVLVRVRGSGAGALLSFYLGRLRYMSVDGELSGELWARPLLARYELTEEHWESARLSPVFDRRVGRRQELAFWVKPGKAPPPGSTRDFHEDVEPDGVLEHHALLVFEPALTKALCGERFLSALPRE